MPRREKKGTREKGDRFEWHLLSPLGMTTSLDFRAGRLSCSSQ